MATIPMIPIGSVTTLNRSILRTEKGMSGTGGDDFICGHCGYVILEDFDPSTVGGNPVYQCVAQLRGAVTRRLAPIHTIQNSESPVLGHTAEFPLACVH